MKTRLLLTLALFSLVLFTTCSKKTEVTDPCDGVICNNGGDCVNGECECTAGFQGPNCDGLMIPSSMVIEALEITRFPSFEPNGGTWDLITNTAPDLTFQVAREGEAAFYIHAELFPDAQANQKHVFDNLSIDLPFPAVQKYSIILYDSDTDADDWMGGVTGLIHQLGEKHPKEIEFDAGGTVAFIITVRYVF